jgi:hypothetical protein
MSEITEEKITDTLKRVWAREQAAGRDPVYSTTPLDELLAREGGEEVEEHLIRLEAFRRLLEYFFGDGPHPGQVIRRVFAITKALRPTLVLNMSLEEIGLMLGETKAAGSWRIKQLVNRPIARSCGHETNLPWQKSSTAVASYAATRRRKHQEKQQSHR